MATDKLVDFDHVTDYISREAVFELIDNAPVIAGNENESLISAPELLDNIFCLPAADVRPVAEIDDAVYDAMYYLNSVSSQMPYHVYSALFDLICGIFQTCGTDMRESNLDTTKGERRDELSG